jgi:hypothetical protein
MELKFAKAANRKDMIAINPLRMFDMMDSMDGASPTESLSMMCFALSLLYRSMIDESKMTMTQFTESIGKQVHELIIRPPEGFADDPPTPGCDCDVCEEKRARRARAH